MRDRRGDYHLDKVTGIVRVALSQDEKGVLGDFISTHDLVDEYLQQKEIIKDLLKKLEDLGEKPDNPILIKALRNDSNTKFR